MKYALILIFLLASTNAMASRCGKLITIENSLDRNKVIKFFVKTSYSNVAEESRKSYMSSLSPSLHVPKNTTVEYTLIYSCMPMIESQVDFYYKSKWSLKRKKINNGFIKI